MFSLSCCKDVSNCERGGGGYVQNGVTSAGQSSQTHVRFSCRTGKRRSIRSVPVDCDVGHGYLKNASLSCP